MPRDNKIATKAHEMGALCVCHMAKPAGCLLIFFPGLSHPSWLPFTFRSARKQRQTSRQTNKQTNISDWLASHESVVFTFALFCAFFVYGIINPFS